MPAGVELLQSYVTVMPGEAASATIRLVNTGRIVDELTLEVLGDAAGYATIQPARLPLYPGAQADAVVTFRPARGPVPGAGLVPFGIRVRSREDRAFSSVVEGRVEIGVAVDVGARLSPRTSTGSRLGQRARHRLEIENNGNAVARIRIGATDADERLRFAIPQPVVSIPAGGRTVMTIGVKARRRMMTGGQATLPFQVVVAPDGHAPIALDGMLTQRSTVIGGTNQILTIAVVVGVAGLLASQLLPRALPPTIADPTLTAVQSAVAGTAGTTPEASSSAPPTEAPATADAATPEPSAQPSETSAPTAPAETAAPTPSAAPLTLSIFTLGLVDPLGASMLETPVPDPTPTPAPTAGGTFNPPIRPFPTFPTFVLISPSGNASGGAIAATRGFTAAAPRAQEHPDGPPLQEFGLEVTGPVVARITNVSDGTEPILCLSRDGDQPQCLPGRGILNGDPDGEGSRAWFLSVAAQQGGTTVDLTVQYPPQPVTFGFQNLHLAGVSAGSGVHLAVQASQAGLIAIVTRVNVGADVTVTIRDLNGGSTPSPSTIPAGATGSPFLAAAEAGHFYDILISSSSPDEVFVSGTISWP